MKAVLVDRYHTPVHLGEARAPEVGDEDVLVEVHAASVNPVDAKIRDGEFKLFLPHRLPLILGNDFAGVVTRVGSRVQQFKPGDEVYASAPTDRIGAFAELIAVKESALALKPRNLTMEEAASIPLVGLTTWQAFVVKVHLKPGQKVLIHAGAGGVGTFAIQLARHLGATVATTTSTANIDLVKRLGADVVVDYRREDFEAVVRDYDVVLNSLGRDVLEKSLRVLRRGGTLISISGPPDPDFARQIGAALPLRLAMRQLSSRIRNQAKRRGVTYAFLFMRAHGRQLSEITSLIEAGAIRPVVDQVFPFERTSEAIAYVERGHAKGKVVVRLT